jgi:signal transduction histidine kinase
MAEAGHVVAALALPDMGAARPPPKRRLDARTLALVLLVLAVQVGGTALLARHGPGTGPDLPGSGFPGPEGPRWGDRGYDYNGYDYNAGRLPVDPLGYLLLAVGPLALVFRRRFPVWVLLVNGAAVTGYLVLGYRYGPIFLSVVVALMNAVWRDRRLAAWLVGVPGPLVSFGSQHLVGRGREPTVAATLGSLAWVLVALLVAEAVRFRRERLAQADRAREQRVRQIADEERLRIARELHDVLAHNISMINIQAGVALHLADELPEPTRAALQTIKEASRDTLRELRATLGALRRVDEHAPRDPAPGLGRLDEMLARTTASGINVRKDVVGTPRPLPAGTDLAAYRIVQEALTNAYRHSGAGTVRVGIGYADTELTLTVEDDGTGEGRDTDGSGTGIAGMRERAHALGGSLTAEPRRGGGFRVYAVLPLPPRDEPPDNPTGGPTGGPTDNASDNPTDNPTDNPGDIRAETP